MVTLRLTIALFFFLLLSGLLVGCETSRIISIASPEISVQTGTSELLTEDSLKAAILRGGGK